MKQHCMNEFNIDDDGLRISFFRAPGADRWRLAIGYFSDGEDRTTWIPLLTSIAGVTDEAWPDFPPLQELLPGTHAGKPSVQLVGMAGKHHWSLSVAWQPEHAQWLFDFACRCESPPGPGQAAFALARNTRIEACPQAVELQTSDSQRSLTIFTTGLPDVASTITCEPSTMLAASHELKITGTAPLPAPGRETLRWYFGLRAT